MCERCGPACVAYCPWARYVGLHSGAALSQLPAHWRGPMLRTCQLAPMAAIARPGRAGGCSVTEWITLTPLVLFLVGMLSSLLWAGQ